WKKWNFRFNEKCPRSNPWVYIKCWCLIAQKCWKLIAIFCWKVLAVYINLDMRVEFQFRHR
ncbi:MAG: hypothetical protein IKY94_01595, partial [Lachnospiraceae bacterium]|nr:hypothetical protein [Lachnospiraceae bacterium]